MSMTPGALIQSDRNEILLAMYPASIIMLLQGTYLPVEGAVQEGACKRVQGVTYGTGIDVGEVCRNVRSSKRGLPILHIGSTVPYGLPADVPTLSENFTADGLLMTVGALIQPALMRVGDAPLQAE